MKCEQKGDWTDNHLNPKEVEMIKAADTEQPPIFGPETAKDGILRYKTGGISGIYSQQRLEKIAEKCGIKIEYC